MYSLFIGRFQPFHNGHLQVVQEIIGNNEKVLIAIGSSQISHAPTDPLTSQERITIIQNALTENNISADQYTIIPIPDINCNALWVEYLAKTLPEFNKIYSGSPLVKQLFKEDGRYELNVLERYNNVSATQIRNDIIQEDPDWRKHVPHATADFITSHQIVERLQNLES